MADDRADRFQRIARARTGNLFEHFGVEIEPRQAVEGPVIDALPCENCGWYRAIGETAPCQVCGFLGKRQG